MRSLWDRILLRPSFESITYIFLALSTVVYYSLFGLGNDFPIFHRAGFAMQTLDDPWSTSSDPTYSSYLNGPNTSLLFLLVSFFPLEQGVLLVRILTVASIPLTAHIVLKRFGLDPYLWPVSLLLLCSFSVRSNLEYGSLYVIYLSFAIFTVTISKPRQNASAHVLIGIFTGLCVDYKPQSFLILLLMLGNRYRIFGFLVTLISGSIISILFTSSLPYFRWFEAISTRGQATFKSPDQMSILGIAWELGMPLWIPGSVTLFLLVLAGFRIFALWVPGYRIYCFSALFIALTWLNFFLHPTDLMLVALLISVFLLKRSCSEILKVHYFALGACLVWSNNSLVQLGVMLSVFIGIRRFPQFRDNSIWLLVPSIIFAISVHFFPHEQNVNRHLINYVPVAFCLIYVDRLLRIIGAEVGRRAPKNS